MKIVLLGEDKSDVIETILSNRGIAREDMKNYMEYNYSLINIPSKLDVSYYGRSCMKTMCEVILSVINKKKKVIVVVDSDCDGFTSAAEICNYLYCLNNEWCVECVDYVFHDGKKHGIDTSKIPDDTGLVIVPDAGTNDVEQCERLRTKGIPVIILDHHNKDEESGDNVYPMIINNQLCDYPNKELSGAGVVFQFLCFFDEYLSMSYQNHISYSFNCMDLCAVGNIGDMMALTSIETRHLCDIGISHDYLNNPFLLELKQGNENLDGEDLIVSQVAFYICPYINAVNRSGTQQEKRLVFESMLKYKAYSLIDSNKRGEKGKKAVLVTEAVRVATNVKARQKKDIDKGIEELDQIVENQKLYNHSVMVIVAKDFNENISGLMASDYSKKYQRPVAILKESNGKYVGSCRGFKPCGIIDFQQECLKSGLIEWAKGHGNAFGLCLDVDNVDKFVDYMDNLFTVDGEYVHYVDYVWNGRKFQNDLDIIAISKLDYLWGAEFEQPKVIVMNVCISFSTTKIIGKNKDTVKIKIPDSNTVIMMFHAEEFIQRYGLINTYYVGCMYVDIVGTCNENIWHGMSTPQIFVEDWCESNSAF